MLVGFVDTVLDSMPVISGIRRRWYVRRVQLLLESGRRTVPLVVLEGYVKHKNRRGVLPASVFSSWQDYANSARLPADLRAIRSGFDCESPRWTAPLLVVAGLLKQCANV